MAGRNLGITTQVLRIVDRTSSKSRLTSFVELYFVLRTESSELMNKKGKVRKKKRKLLFTPPVLLHHTLPGMLFFRPFAIDVTHVDRLAGR